MPKMLSYKLIEFRESSSLSFLCTLTIDYLKEAIVVVTLHV